MLTLLSVTFSTGQSKNLLVAPYPKAENKWEKLAARLCREYGVELWSSSVCFADRQGKIYMSKINTEFDVLTVLHEIGHEKFQSESKFSHLLIEEISAWQFAFARISPSYESKQEARKCVMSYVHSQGIPSFVRDEFKSLFGKVFD